MGANNQGDERVSKRLKNDEYKLPAGALILACLLLVAGPVYAESVSTAEYVISGDPPKVEVQMCRIWNRAWFPSRKDGTCYAVDEHASPCLARMEEALKALHPFSMLNLDPVQEQFGLDMVKKKADWSYQAELPYEDPVEFTPYGLTQTMNAKAGRAIVLWDTVRRECWRQP